MAGWPFLLHCQWFTPVSILYRTLLLEIEPVSKPTVWHEPKTTSKWFRAPAAAWRIDRALGCFSQRTGGSSLRFVFSSTCPPHPTPPPPPHPPLPPLRAWHLRDECLGTLWNCSQAKWRPLKGLVGVGLKYGRETTVNRCFYSLIYLSRGLLPIYRPVKDTLLFNWWKLFFKSMFQREKNKICSVKDKQWHLQCTDAVWSSGCQTNAPTHTHTHTPFSHWLPKECVRRNHLKKSPDTTMFVFYCSIKVYKGGCVRAWGDDYWEMLTFIVAVWIMSVWKPIADWPSALGESMKHYFSQPCRKGLSWALSE